MKKTVGNDHPAFEGIKEENIKMISTTTAMRMLDIKNLATLKKMEREGLLTIYRLSRKTFKCKLSEINAIPQKIKDRQAQQRSALLELIDQGFEFGNQWGSIEGRAQAGGKM